MRNWRPCPGAFRSDRVDQPPHVRLLRGDRLGRVQHLKCERARNEPRQQHGCEIGAPAPAHSDLTVLTSPHTCACCAVIGSAVYNISNASARGMSRGSSTDAKLAPMPRLIPI